jgi:hypothetical protein
MTSMVGARVEMGARYHGGACLDSLEGRQAPSARLRRLQIPRQATCKFAALHMVENGTTRASGDVRLESEKRSKADIAQPLSPNHDL